MAVSKVKSIATRRFWELFQALPFEVQDLAVKNYDLRRQNPRHPSLRFRRLQGSEDRFSIRVGDHYRALGRLAGEKISGFGSARTQTTTGWQALEREEHGLRDQMTQTRLHGIYPQDHCFEEGCRADRWIGVITVNLDL